MSKPRLLIVIEGGMIQHIYATDEIDVKVIDYDLEEPFDMLESNALDAVHENLYEAFTDSYGPKGIEMRDELKRLKL